MSDTPRGGALPLDIRTRERMRDAQLAETRAVNAICSAQAALVRAAAKRDRAVSAADAVLGKAELELVRRHAALVAVSGLERAAALLDTTPAKLRRTTSAALGEAPSEGRR